MPDEMIPDTLIEMLEGAGRCIEVDSTYNDEEPEQETGVKEIAVDENGTLWLFGPKHEPKSIYHSERWWRVRVLPDN